MTSFQEYGIEIQAGKTGEISVVCPKCSPERKKKNSPCLSVNVDRGVWFCHHCGWEGGLKTGINTQPTFSKKPKQYRKPEPVNEYCLSKEAQKWIESRGISRLVTDRNKLFSQKIYMPQTESEANCIAFPYFRNGEMINCKYRDGNKNFRGVGNAERILYGMDDIASDCLIWVEGEIDKLSIEEAGFKSCVSVPDGAPAKNTKDFSSKFDYLSLIQDKLEAVQKHIIAVDNDLPGQTLQAELIRRLTPEKCYSVEFPEGCKDANDVLLKHGATALNAIIKAAKPIPIEGVFTAGDCYDDLIKVYYEGSNKGLSTGFQQLDPYYTVRPGEFTVVTGIPGSGKSELTDAISINMAMNHGWKIAVCSPENQPIREHAIKLMEKVTEKPFSEGKTERMTVADLNHAVDWLQKRFFFVLPEVLTLDNVLSKAASLIKSQGINGLIIDPWNEIEAEKPFGVSETEYISQCLSKMRRFTRKHMIHLWIVAHPTKLNKDLKTGKYPVPTPYDISGSAHWRNKADNAITVHRDIPSTQVQVHVQKIRFKVVGKVGMVELNYNPINGIYY